MEKSHDIHLSQEKDEHGKQFVISTDGTTTFGRMESESGLADVPIKQFSKVFQLFQFQFSFWAVESG
jgi:hypothetical protein